jgi:hypothetical protein
MRDAQWELDDDFADMAAPPQVICEFCDSNEGAEENYLWKMCNICGASGVHWTCFEHIESPEFVCRNCNEILEKKASQPKPKTPRKKKQVSNDGLPILFLASDEELCTTDDEQSSHRNLPSTSTSGSNSDKENMAKSSPAKQNEDDSSDEEIIKRPKGKRRSAIISDESSSDEDIVKPKSKRRHTIVSDESSDEEEITFPKRKKIRSLLSTPETPKIKTRHSSQRL